ncbi:cation:proton antiporter subunit C [Halopenitus sp. H-Gu1]|uniref:cation:proton antiporter subunit C n=1 Tax=Halopenitus sp. H-Gu1 TaxID=3242697 RepID=UPI00359D6C98
MTTAIMLTIVDLLMTRHAYAVFAILLCIGLYMMIANEHLVKKIIGLNLFQTAIFLFFIASAYVRGGSIPIVHGADGAEAVHVSPLPQVIVLTAIVVGVSLTAVGLALCLRIYAEYGTLRTDALREVMRDEDVLPGETDASGAPATERSTGGKEGGDAA